MYLVLLFRITRRLNRSETCIQGGRVGFNFMLNKKLLYQLAEVLSSLGRSRAGSSLHPLLFALGRPGGEHGGLDGERRLPEILVFKCLISADALGRAVRQKSRRDR